MPKYKILYDSLTENNELLGLFPELRNREAKNSWELDKDIFTELLYKQEQALEDFIIDDEEEDLLCQ